MLQQATSRHARECKKTFIEKELVDADDDDPGGLCIDIPYLPCGVLLLCLRQNSRSRFSNSIRAPAIGVIKACVGEIRTSRAAASYNENGQRLAKRRSTPRKRMRVAKYANVLVKESETIFKSYQKM
uniref:30S ribosomal protein S20 n=1 Tax=Panagrellus redivivus TaxID=6233 RepID=A0A7E4WEB8_PANRE